MLNRTLDDETYESTRMAQQPRGGGPASLGLDDVKSYIQPVEGFILKYPGPALASAFLLGVLVACWIKRK